MNSANDTALMQSVTEKAIADMNGVYTIQMRAVQIADIWKSANSSCFEYLSLYPLPASDASTCLDKVSAALSEADVQNFISYSSLQNEAYRNDAALNALALSEDYINSLKILENATQWIIDTQTVAEKPLSAVLPQHYEICLILIDRYYSFYEEEIKFIDHELKDCLIKAQDMASLKTQAIEKLNALLESIDETLYSQENIEKIKEIIKTSQSSLLSSASGEEIDSIILSASQQISEITKENDPPSTEDPDEDLPDQENPDENQPDQETPENSSGDMIEKDYKTAVIAVSIASFVIALSSIISLISVIFLKHKNSIIIVNIKKLKHLI